MLIISTPKVFLFALAMGLLSACCSISYFEYTRFVELPVVQYDDGGVCKNVVNYKNGDAYNCNDVDVILRKYRKSHLSKVSQAANASSQPAEVKQ